MPALLDWSSICLSSESLPLSDQSSRVYTGTALLIFCYSACAASCCVALLLLSRSSPSDRADAFPLYGAFLWTMLAACVAGIIAWVANAQYLDSYFFAETQVLRSSSYYIARASADRMRAVHLPFFGAEVILFCSSLLIMLRRVLDLLSLRDAEVKARSKTIGRRIYAFTLIVNVAGLCLNVAAAIILGDVANLSMTLSDATNITQAPTSTCSPSSAAACDQQLGDRITLVNQLAATQRRCEATVMIVLMISFVVSCYYINKRIILALAAVSSLVIETSLRSAQANLRSVQNRIRFAVVFASLCFTLRALYTGFVTFAEWRAPGSSDDACAKCGPCQETGWLMYRWWRFTPLFSLLTTIFISPLPLFVIFVVLTRDYALLRGSKQRSLQDSTDATREFHDT